jgi:hypothetical protein
MQLMGDELAREAFATILRAALLAEGLDIPVSVDELEFAAEEQVAISSFTAGLLTPKTWGMGPKNVQHDFEFDVLFSTSKPGATLGESRSRAALIRSVIASAVPTGNVAINPTVSVQMNAGRYEVDAAPTVDKKAYVGRGFVTIVCMQMINRA